MSKTPRKLRVLRKDKGMTLEELAEKARVSVSSIGNFETGSRGMGEENKRRIAEVLHVGVEEISEPLKPTEDVTYNGDPEAPRPLEFRHITPSTVTLARNLMACVQSGDAIAALKQWTIVEPDLKAAAQKQSSTRQQSDPDGAGPPPAEKE